MLSSFYINLYIRYVLRRLPLFDTFYFAGGTQRTKVSVVVDASYSKFKLGKFKLVRSRIVIIIGTIIIYNVVYKKKLI